MPTGKWFDNIKDRLTLVEVDPPAEIFGNAITHYAHQADVIRLSMLHEHGGIYMDVDTICVEPFTELLNNECVIGAERGVGLCNGVLMAAESSPFIRHWIDSYASFDSRQWAHHSVKIPSLLSKRYPDLITVMPYDSFHYPTWRDSDLKLLFEEDIKFEAAYCHHLWETKSWDRYLKSLSEEYIKNVGTTYNRVARRFL